MRRDVSSDEEGRLTETTVFANIPIPGCKGCPCRSDFNEIARCGFYDKQLGDPDLNCSVTEVRVTEKT
jgi:hypothetical protein